MYRKSTLLLAPVMLASLLVVTACDKKPRAETVVVEEDTVLNNGSVVKDWIVDEIVPIPARKPASLADRRPSNEYIWIPGEWSRRGETWEWESGRWSKPPTANASWMPGHWRMIENKWHWAPGYWVVTGSQQHVMEKPVAPALLEEVRPEKPSNHNHWVAGYWDWDGHWYWVKGYWTSKPHPDAEWVPAHWEDFGMNGGFRWIGGHWRVKS